MAMDNDPLFRQAKVLGSTFIFASLLIVLSESCLVLSGTLIRVLTDDVSTEMLVFARNLFGLLLLLPWVFHQGLGAIKTNRIQIHLLRSLVGICAMYCLYYSWGHLPLAEAALLKQTSPLFIPLIAFLWLKEGIRLFTKIALMIGFLGVYVILNPSEGAFEFAVIIALLGAFLGGLAKVIIRRMANTESSPKIVFYFSFFTALFSAGPAIASWQTPSWQQTGMLALMALFSTLAQLLLSRAYALAPAGLLAPFTFSSVAIASLIGWWLWNERVDWLTLIGITLIFAACTINVMQPKARAVA